MMDQMASSKTSFLILTFILIPMVLGQGLEKITCGKKWDRRSGSVVQQELVSVPPASKLAMMMSQWAPHISTVSSCLDLDVPTTVESTTTNASPTTGAIPTTTQSDAPITAEKTTGVSPATDDIQTASTNAPHTNEKTTDVTPIRTDDIRTTSTNAPHTDEKTTNVTPIRTDDIRTTSTNAPNTDEKTTDVSPTTDDVRTTSANVPDVDETTTDVTPITTDNIQTTSANAQNRDERTTDVSTTDDIPTTTDSGIPADAVPLGLQSSAIPDSRITVSSTSGMNVAKFGPSKGRLHLAGGWCANGHSSNEWIQVDFQSPHRIVGIATQGRSNYDQWVTSYKVLCSANGTKFNVVEEMCSSSGNYMTFQGNMDRNTVVYNALPRPQNCQSVRVAPLTCHKLICMRLEVYEQTPGVPDDVVPLGMESENILVSSLQISGCASLGLGGLWRLNKNPIFKGAVPSGCEWIQVDLQTLEKVVGIATQGSKPDIGSWVTSYKISYGTDGVNFNFVQGSCGDMIFTANWDSQTVVFNRLPNPVTCRFIRIVPVSWNPQENTVFRIELYGSSA